MTKTNGITKPIKAELPQPAPRRVNLINDTSAKQQVPPVVANNTTAINNPQKPSMNGTTTTTHQNNPSKTEQNQHHKKVSPSASSPSGGEGDEQVLPKPITNEEFQAMIPAHFLNNNNKTPNTEPVHAVTVTVKKPDPIELPPPPTGPGRVTETITKSTFTETVVTRITDNKLVVPVVIEVCRQTQLLLACFNAL